MKCIVSSRKLQKYDHLLQDDDGDKDEILLHGQAHQMEHDSNQSHCGMNIFNSMVEQCSGSLHF